MAMVKGGAFAIAPLGEIWYAIDRASLNGLQAGVERYVSVWLWESVLAPILQWPAILVFFIPGVLLAILCRSRPARRRFD